MKHLKLLNQNQLADILTLTMITMSIVSLNQNNIIHTYLIQHYLEVKMKD